jgi:hypothetical protein
MWRTVLLGGLALFIVLAGIAPARAFDSASPGESLSAPIEAVKPAPLVVSPAVSRYLENSFGPGWQRWIAADESSAWSEAELEQLHAILDHTLAALADAGLDGVALLDGYRFRRVEGEFVRPEERIAALANHGDQIISLAGAAFVRQQGFYIYHELGHAVDYRLGRRLGEQFHWLAGSGYVPADGEQRWLTAAGYWMRPLARDARGEATADAFGLWVSSAYAGSRHPVYPGISTPVNYEAIKLATRAALFTAGAELGPSGE